MSNAMSDPLIPPEKLPEGAVGGGEDCGSGPEEFEEAWSPFREENNDPKAPAPCNSPVDSGVILADDWGWEDSPESNSSPATASMPSPPAPEPPNKDLIGRMFFPVCMATSPACGHFLVTAFAQQTGRSWTSALTVHDISDEPCLISSCALDTTASFVAFCDDSAASLLVAHDNGYLTQMALPRGRHSGSVIQERCEHDAPFSSLAISRGCTRAFSCDVSGCVCVWDPMVALANLITRPSRNFTPSDSVVAAHPILERRFISAGANVVRFWEEEEEVKTFALSKGGRHTASVTRVDWTEENSVLIGWSDGTVQLVDIRQCEKPLWSVEGGIHGREVVALCGTASGAIVTVSGDNCLRVWKVGSEEAAEKWSLSGGSVWDSRCVDKLVTAMSPLPGPETCVLVSCRDQSWWRWREGSEGVECVTLPLGQS